MFALEFLRIDGRQHEPAYSNIPVDTKPADELNLFLETMHKIGTPIARMSPGRYAVHIPEAGQVWSVRIVRVGDPEDTQHDLQAVS